METEALLAKIQAYCAASGMKPSVFGLKAVNDGKLVPRLEAGGECLPRTAQKILAFIGRPQSQPQSEDAA